MFRVKKCDIQRVLWGQVFYFNPMAYKGPKYKILYAASCKCGYEWPPYCLVANAQCAPEFHDCLFVQPVSENIFSWA